MRTLELDIYSAIAHAVAGSDVTKVDVDIATQSILKMVAALEAQLAEAREALDRIARNIHYPDCWDTAPYPTLADAVCEITHCDPQLCTKIERSEG